MFDQSLLSDLHEPRWFVLFVRSNQEKKVAQRLTDREIDHFLPCYPSLRQWKDRRITLDMPLFPGYVFVRLPFFHRDRVLTVPNIVGLVGGRNSPSVISEEEIGWIRRGLEHGRATPHPYLNIGERIRVIAGALSGMEGVLVRRQNGTRVIVSLDSIGRSFAVEVDLACLAPITPAHIYREAV